MSIEAMTAVRKMAITPSARKFVAMALADYADEGGTCWPSIETLAEYTSQSARSVQGHLTALETLGFLSRIRTRNSSGQLGQYRYVIDHRKNLPLAKSATGKKLHSPPEESAGHNHHTSPNGDETPICPKATFEDFWDNYPDKRNNSKKATEAEWKKLDEADRVAARLALGPYAKFLKTPNAPSCVYAVRFLSQRRFDGYAEQATAQILTITPAELPDTHEGRFLTKCREDGASEISVRSWLGQFTVERFGEQWACVVDSRENEFREKFGATMKRLKLVVYPASYADKRRAK